VGKLATLLDGVPITRVIDLMFCKEAGMGGLDHKENTPSIPQCINIGTMTGRSGEVLEIFYKRKRNVGIRCVQETPWKGSNTRVLAKDISQYKFFWHSCKDGNAGDYSLQKMD